MDSALALRYVFGFENTKKAAISGPNALETRIIYNISLFKKNIVKNALFQTFFLLKSLACNC